MFFQNQLIPQRSIYLNTQSQSFQNFQSNMTFKPNHKEYNQSKYVTTEAPNQSKYKEEFYVSMHQQKNITQFTTMMKLIKFYSKQISDNDKKIQIKQANLKNLAQQRNNLIDHIQQIRRKYKTKQRSLSHKRCKSQQKSKLKIKGQELHVNGLKNQIKRLKQQYFTSDNSYRRNVLRKSYYSNQKQIKNAQKASQLYHITTTTKNNHHRQQKVRTKIIYIPIILPPYYYNPQVNPPINHINTSRSMNKHHPYYYNQQDTDRMVYQQRRNSNSKQIKRSRASNRSQLQKSSNFIKQNNKIEEFIMKLSNQLRNNTNQSQQKQKYQTCLPIQQNAQQQSQSKHLKQPENIKQIAIKEFSSVENSDNINKTILSQSYTKKMQLKQIDYNKQSKNKENVVQSQIKILLPSINSTYFNKNLSGKEMLDNSLRQEDKSRIKISINNLYESNQSDFQDNHLSDKMNEGDEEDDLIYTIKLDTQSKISKINNLQKQKDDHLLCIPKEFRAALSSITERSEEKDYPSKHSNSIFRSQMQSYDKLHQRTEQKQYEDIPTLKQYEDDQDLLLSNLRASTTKNIIKSGSKMYHKPKSNNISSKNTKTMKKST